MLENIDGIFTGTEMEIYETFARSTQISDSSCINIDSIREIISICAWTGLFMKGKQQAGPTNYELSLVGGL